MKKRCLLLVLTGLFTSQTALGQLSAPRLSLGNNGVAMNLTWSPVSGASGYRLYYTPYPYNANNGIQSAEMGGSLSYDATLWEDAAYYVAIKAYNGSESSDYSNIEYFVLGSDHIDFTSDQGSFNGLTLLAPMTSTSTYLIDDTGQKKHEWQSNYTPGLSAYLLPDGTLLRTGRAGNSVFNTAGGQGGYIEEMDWNGNTTWLFKYCDESKCLHHDIERLPNGNTLALSWELKDKLWTEVIIEVEKNGDNNGTVVWRWDVWDHLDDLGLDSSSATIADWIHLNSIDYNQATNQIMISSRSHNQIWIINKNDGSIAAISGVPLFGQHNAAWIDDGNADSNITIFDNGSHYSRALEVDSLMQSIVWSYGNASDEYFHGNHISGVQRLDNGNTLVCNGVDGVIFELDGNKNKLREYSNSYGGSTPQGVSTEIFRAEKYPSGYTPYF